MRLLSGIEIVDVEEFRQQLAQHNDSFISQNFSKNEQDYCESRNKMKHEHYAGRLAVKRAFIKALELTQESIPLNEIEVARDEGRMPVLQLSDRAKQIADIGEKDKILISLAHERKLAVGTVVITKSE